MADEQVCIICKTSLTVGDVVTVSRGLPTLVKASVCREDGLETYLKMLIH